MKVILREHKFPLFIALLLLTTQVFAEDPLVEKKKTYTKSYPVSNSDKISLTNQFGEMKISTWDKNEVSVTVTITAEAKTDERAQAILDNISVEDGKGSDGVYFKTKLDKNKDKDQQWSKGEKTSFHIDYVVNLPARNPLQAKNEFGPMTIGDYNGEVTLESKFGSLTTGKLNNVKKVVIEFGKGSIGSISNGNLIIKFSKAAIDNLDGSVNAVFEYCDIAKLRVDNSTKALTVKNSFSNLYLDLNTNISANFDISTNFGELHNKTSFDIKEEGDNDDRHGPRFNKRYQGKAGSGNTEMKIKSEYGQITLGHNLNIDMNKDKNKDKDKDKDKDRKGTVRI
ncbi:hypothetical protein A4D02_12675 [Niastella koreensis]|uniref:Adhesin domain-containing protein n=2 Tax=Niastella koreensis TaxID=354356 RepID=G8TJQ8_NIAKG|nr:hypothetical protein [Niastella koreensis]AEW00805.1 hypothetical protein Niako_4547 [Niastella koreensis GR20-10]OQP42422.1 hypothetical protein A4D02_12675 [Niastella koreensis]